DIDVDKDDNVHVVWQDPTIQVGAGSDWDILYRCWNRTTRTWKATEVISIGSGVASESPKIVSDESGNLHVIWFDWNTGTDSDVYYSLWNKTLGVWSSRVLVSVESSLAALWPDIAVKNEVVYLVWQDNTNYLGNGGDHDLLFKKRFTNGTWTTAEVVTSESSLVSRFPSIVVDDDSNIYVSWDDAYNYGGSGGDQDVYFKVRNSTTDSWTLPTLISTESSLYSERSDITIDSLGNRYIAWLDGTNYNGSGATADIFFKKWSSSSKSWSLTEVVSTTSTGPAFVPNIVTDGFDNLHFLWFDETNYHSSGLDQDVFHKMFNSSSNSWSQVSVVSTNAADDSWRPLADVDSLNTIHTVWMDRTPNYGGSGLDIDIMYKYGYDVELVKEIEELSIISSPNDVTYQVNTTGHQLSWILIDENVSNPIYTIYKNTTWILNNSWDSNIPISYDIDGLEVGVYNFVLFAYDGWGNQVADNVKVTVTTEPVEPEIPPLNLDILKEVGYGLLIAFGTVGLSTLIIVRRGK
ncbi:MAG: hypothetical protein ACXABJ_06765, partial [Candidatus Heimdallarchaeaceae archaeon]